jgi:hypothetical protein
MKTILALTFAFATGLTNAQQVFGDENRAWMVGPAKAVSSGMVLSHLFLASGTKLIYSTVEPTQVFDPYSTSTPRSKWFIYLCDQNVSVEIPIPGSTTATEVAVLGGEQVLFYSDRKNLGVQGFFDLRTGQIQKTQLDHSKVFYSGSKKEAPFLMYEVSDDSVGVLVPGSAPIIYKTNPGVGIDEPYFSDQGVIKLRAYSRDIRPMKFYDATLDRKTGALKLVSVSREKWIGLDLGLDQVSKGDKFQLSEWDRMTGISLSPERSNRGGGLAKTTPAIDLDRMVGLCPASFKPLLSPNGACVAYVDNGALLLREIKSIDFQLALRIKADELRSKALSEAKQVGLALLICAADLDDVFPTGENFVNRLAPYIMDREALNGFNYTFAGGPIDQIKDPSKTELGFTMAPGGRAVVYADGHAKWVPDKP